MKKRNSIEVSDIEAVFVDMDGTLLDSISGLYQVYISFLNKFGAKGTKAEFNELNGPSLPEIITTLKARHDLPGSKQNLIQQYRSMFHDFYAKEVKLFPGAINVLKLIREIPLKLVLVTSSSLDVVDVALKSHKLTGFFDTIVTGDKVKHSKPDPEIFLKTLKAVKIKPEHAIVIEDSPHGVEAALRARIYTIRINANVDQARFHEDWMELKDWNVVNKMFRIWYD